MAGFDKDKAREVLKIPRGFEPVTMMAMGYQGDLDDADESIRARELKPRVRKPLEEIVFEGVWPID